MAKKAFKGIRQVVEDSGATLQEGVLYFVRKDDDVSGDSGYISFNGKKYGNGLPVVTSEDNLKVMQVRDGSWEVVTPLVVYSGGDSMPPSSLGNEGDIFLQTGEMLRKPDVIYETDGTTGLLGHNGSSLDNNWQLQNLVLSAYTHLRCYFAAGTATGDSRTPAVVVEIPLDAAAIGPTGYIGSTMTPLPFNRNREYMISCAVDSTKTKFQVIHQNTLWDISTSDANNNGRYCYKIEGWY